MFADAVLASFKNTRDVGRQQFNWLNIPCIYFGMFVNSHSTVSGGNNTTPLEEDNEDENCAKECLFLHQ